MHFMFVSEVDECLINPCPEGAKCVEGVNTYTCECPEGNAGKHCDVGEYTY